MTAQRHEYITEEEYLEFEEQAEGKYEYLNGQIYAMSGGTAEHSEIAINVVLTLRSHLRGKGCKVYNSDLKVKAPGSNLSAFPDASVVCGKSIFEDSKRTALLNPILIVEVLSPSTERRDRTTKFDQYARIDSLRDYVLVSPDSAYVEHYSRTEDNKWIRGIASEMDGAIDIESINYVLELVDIYDGVEFPAPQVIPILPTNLSEDENGL